MRFITKNIQDHSEPLKLSIKDKRLIQLLINDGRKSVSDLAKEVGISSSAIVQKMESLRKKGALVNGIALTSPKLPTNRDLYVYEIQTNLGMNNLETNNQILSIPGIFVILWYNGAFNLVTASTNKDPQEVLEGIERIIPITKLRILKMADGWFHPPRIFEEVKEKKVEFKRTHPEVDELDIKLISALEKDVRSPIINLAHEVKSSVETVKKRLKKLKENGAILGLTTYIDPQVFGLSQIAVLFKTKGRKNINELICELLTIPQVGNVWEYSNEWSVDSIFYVRDQKEINDILSSIYKKCNGIMEAEVMALSRTLGK